MQTYAMFSEAGNAAVGAVVMMAESKAWTWEQTEQALYKLSEVPEFGEASDTAVREAVYVALKFHLL
jgi:hypothetical protein